MANTNRRVNDGFRWADERQVFNTFLNMCFAPAGLVSGLAPKISTLYNIQYCISGYIYSLASGATGVASVTGNTLAAQGSGTYCQYAVCVNSAGSIFVMKGIEKSAASFDSVSVFLPSVPSSLCFIGHVLVSLESNVSWSCGVSAFSVDNAYFHNCAMIPQGVILST